MKPPTPLQSIVDPFVRGVGGELVAELVGNNNPPRSADYLFRAHKVIAELKALETDSFGDSLRRKLGDLMAQWRRTGRLVVYGTARIDTNRLSPECQNEIFDIIAAPLQRVVKTADSQIASTKEILNMPEAKGLLWVASDGNLDPQPDQVLHLFNRILLKKRENGDSQYEHIQGLAYFSPRMLAKTPPAEVPTQFWFSGPRRSGDEQMQALLNLLREAWPHYVSWAQGIAVRRIDGTAPPDQLRFMGPKRPLPKIQVSDPDEPRKTANH